MTRDLLTRCRVALRISRADTPNGEDERKALLAELDAVLAAPTVERIHWECSGCASPIATDGTIPGACSCGSIAWFPDVTKTQAAALAPLASAHVVAEGARREAQDQQRARRGADRDVRPQEGKAMTNAEIDAAEARAKAATEGPWHDGGDGILFGTVADESGVWLPEDAAFVSHARTDVPRLIAHVREREADAERLRSDLAATTLARDLSKQDATAAMLELGQHREAMALVRQYLDGIKDRRQPLPTTLATAVWLSEMDRESFDEWLVAQSELRAALKGTP